MDKQLLNSLLLVRPLPMATVEILTQTRASLKAYRIIQLHIPDIYCINSLYNAGLGVGDNQKNEYNQRHINELIYNLIKSEFHIILNNNNSNNNNNKYYKAAIIIMYVSQRNLINSYH